MRSIPILDAKLDEHGLIVTMPYIHGLSGEELLLCGSPSISRKIKESLAMLISLSVSRSKKTSYSCLPVIDKLQTIKAHPKCSARVFKQAIDAIIEHLAIEDQIELPVGPYHGDLTFSNLIYADGIVYVFDFLHSFMHTPLLDYAKLRQEYIYLWSIRYLDRAARMTAIQFAQNSVPTEILKLLEQMYPFQCKLFSIVNLLRIVPYCNDDQTLQWLTICVKVEFEGLF
jgi:thiamine kinase-like enzyme